MGFNELDRGIILICPVCQSDLLRKDFLYFCRSCGQEYPVRDGVVCFLDKEDSFYEGHYSATINFTSKNDSSLKSLLYLYFINSHYLLYVRNYAKKNCKILDVACGGGVKYLACKGDVTGIDLSYASLKNTTAFYRQSIQGSVFKMPFPDSSYDLITSCYAFEHFKPCDKKVLIEEFGRVVKPGGKVVMLFDCDNDNLLFRWIKKNPQLYKERFIELDHHYGLQKASENLRLFEDGGFKILKYRAFNKTVFQHLSVFGWIEPYGSFSKLAGLTCKIALYLGQHRTTSLAYQAFVTLLDDVVEKFLPLDHARLLLVVAERKIK